MKKRLLFLAFWLINYLAPSAQVFEWARLFTPGQIWSSNMVTDNNGNIYTLGTFSNAVDFDPGPATFILNADDNEDIFVHKFDDEGNFIWARHFKGTNDDYARDIAVDDSGNVYITGMFQDTVDFDPGPGVLLLSSGYYFDMFLCKLNGLGQLLWVNQFESTNASYSNSVALDNNGGVYMAGGYGGTIDFDPGPDSANYFTLGTKYFLCKMDTQGNFISVLSQTGLTGGEVSHCEIDDGNNIYLSGFFSGKTDFDPSFDTAYIKPIGFSYNRFILKLFSMDSLLWVRQQSMGVFLEAMALDGEANVILSGAFSGTSDFDPGNGVFNLSSFGQHDPYVWKLNTNGNFVWAKQIRGPNSDYGFGLAVDSAGSIYTSGRFKLTAYFNPSPVDYPLTSFGGDDAYFCKWDKNGNFVWAFQIGSGIHEECRNIAIDQNLNLYTSARYGIGADLDPGSAYVPATSNGRVMIKFRAPGLNFTEFDVHPKTTCYPNPSSGLVFIDLGSVKSRITINVYNTLGQAVKREYVESGQFLELDLGLAPGVYFIDITTREASETLRIIIE